MTKARYAAILAGLALYGITAWFYLNYGRIFLDAGFYMNAAKRVYEGDLLYKDFFFVQSPVYPYVYGLFLNGFGFSVFNARFLSLVFSMLGLIPTLYLSWRWSRLPGLTWTVILLSLAPLHIYHYSSIKLYALTGFWITAALAIYASDINDWFRYPLSGLLAVIAAGTRLTLLPGVLILMIFFAIDAIRNRKMAGGLGIAIAGIMGGVLSLPFVLSAYENTIYFLLKIHTSAEQGPYVFGLKNKLQALIHIVLAHPLLFIFIALGVFALISKRLEWKAQEIKFLLIVIAVTFTNMASNWFSAGYQSVIIPVLAAVAGSWAGRVHFENQRRTRLLFFCSIAVAAFLALMQWKTPLWSSSESILNSLDKTGEFLEVHTKPNAEIAVCNAVLAFSAKRRIADPFGGAPFTFTPNWSTETSRKFGGINAEMLIDYLSRKKYDALLFQPDSFNVGFPGFFIVSKDVQSDIWTTILKYYREVYRFPNLGNGDPDIIFFLPRE